VSNETFYGFKATPEEVAILDRYGIKWSEFCHSNIGKLKKRDRDEFFDKLIIRMLLIAMGGFIFATSTLSNNIFIILVEYVIGLTMVFIGTLSIIVLTYKIKKLEREKHGSRIL